jgi:hypothetical protein
MNAESVVVILLEDNLVFKASGEFWWNVRRFDSKVQDTVRSKFKIFEQNPWGAQWEFKKLPRLKGDIWSVKVYTGKPGYRALAKRIAGDTWKFYWFGTHDEYDVKIRA